MPAPRPDAADDTDAEPTLDERPPAAAGDALDAVALTVDGHRLDAGYRRARSGVGWMVDMGRSSDAIKAPTGGGVVAPGPPSLVGMRHLEGPGGPRY